ncbi:MAG TPA: hypothetical protein VJV03_19800, partial [Pyrinomonadaceae bacterium]|nr:hypothetical protein [Pyrinomonadaceae bacterium]
RTTSQLLELQRAGVRVMPADLRPGLSRQSQAALLRGLAYEPEDRYPTAGSFGDALASALAAERAGRTLRKLKWTSKRAPVVAASLILVMTIAAALGFYMLRPVQPATAPVSTSVRSFSYWLSVQKVRDGKNYQEPFDSTGEEVFENGHKFRINVSSSEPGYLYILQEGLPEVEGTTFTMLYPTPSRSNALVSGPDAQTNWNRFRGQPGTDNIWIIWSSFIVRELETAKHEAFENEKSVLTNTSSIQAVRQLLTKYSQPKPYSVKDSTGRRVQVSGAGDVVVKLAALEHY